MPNTQLVGGIEFAHNTGRRAILIDLRELQEAPFSTIERYIAGKHIADLQRGVGLGIAFALVGHEPIVNRERFGETVGRNRGSNGRVFTDLDAAVEWIDQSVSTIGPADS